MKKNPTLFICIYSPNLNKIGSVISEKIEFFPPNKKKKNKNNNNNYSLGLIILTGLWLQTLNIANN